MTPRYTKLHKNKILQFSQIFMNPCTWNFTKNQMLEFSPIFMTPGTGNFTKIKCFNFLQISWTRVHETSQKSNASIFSKFHDPRYTKLHKNQMLQFSPIFMTNSTWNITKSDPCFSPFWASALESNQFPVLLLLAFWVQPTSRQPVPLQDTVPPKLGFDKSKSAQITYF